MATAIYFATALLLKILIKNNLLILLLGAALGWVGHSYWASPIIVVKDAKPSVFPAPVAADKTIINKNLALPKPKNAVKTIIKSNTLSTQNTAIMLIRKSKTYIEKQNYLLALNTIEEVLAQVQNDYPQADLEQFFIDTSQLYLQQLGDTNAIAVNDFLFQAIHILPNYLQFRYLLGRSLLDLGDEYGARYQLEFLANNQRWKTQFERLKNAINYAKIFQQGDIKIPLIKAQNAWHINAMVDNKPARLIVDTGASVTTLSERLVGQNYARLNKIVLSTANGKTNAFKINIGTLSVGDITQHKFPIVALPESKLPANIDGLLGLDWLSKFHFVIDAPNAILRLSALE